MSIRKAVTATIVAMSMVAMPTVVQAAQAKQTAVSSLSLNRAGAKASKSSDLAGGSLIIAFVDKIWQFKAVLVGCMVGPTQLDRD